MRDELERLGRLGLLATCSTVDLEVLCSARSPSEYQQIAARRKEAFTDLPLDRTIGHRAEAVQAMLAAGSQHRAAGMVDLITSAVARRYVATVLHYDRDFEIISAVTGQETRWVVPAGRAG